METPNKHQLVRIYYAFTKAFNLSWTPIKVRYEPKQPFIPLESEIDQLIAGCGKRTATLLQVLKDTGARIGEIAKLEWTDVNEQNNTIAINNPGKGSRSRTVKVSDKTIAMIKAMPKKYDEYIFKPTADGLREAFYASRKKVASILQNPRILQIHFHTLRHFRATMEYHKTRSILHVQRMLGHKRLDNTEIYTHWVEFENDEWIVRRPQTSKEENELIEADFQYVRYDDREGCPIYKKRK